METTAQNLTPQSNPVPTGAPQPGSVVVQPRTIAAHDYISALAAKRPAKWRAFVTLLLAVVAFFAASAVFAMVAMGIDFALGNQTDLTKITMTPVIMAGVLLGLAVLIPISKGLQRLMYRESGGTLSSLAGRFRWHLIGRFALVMLVVYAIGTAISFAIFGPAMYGASGPVTARIVAIGIVSVLIMPFQAAGEEYLFRGLGNRVIGSLFRSPKAGLIVAGLVTSVLFSAAHGAGDWWLIVYYFVVGVSLTYVTWRTGGLEAAVVIHGINNLGSSIIGTVVGLNPDEMFNRTAGVGGPFMLIPMAVFVLTAVACAKLAERQGVQREIPAIATTEPVRA